MEKIYIQKKDGKIYAPLKDTWLIETPEEIVRQEFILHLINELGYEKEQMDQEVQVNNSRRGNGQARADIVIWKSKIEKRENKSAFIVVECKAENVKLHEEDYFQGYNYASWAGAKFFVTTNQKETKYFNVVKGEIPMALEEILSIPKADEVNDSKRIKEILSETKTFTRDEFARLLFTCHNIIRNNDKLSPEAAFDEISKILFIKIRHEKEVKGKEIFTLKKYKENKKVYEEYQKINYNADKKEYMQTLFEDAKHFYRTNKLFESNEVIKIRENSFEAILEKLQKYNLSDTSDDVKGIAFEEFLGKTFRGELGQFFTPRTIVNFMTHILDPQEGEFICDPTCGSGGFLIKAFEYIREKIEKDVKESKEKLRKIIEGKNYENLKENEKILINEKIDKMQLLLNTELVSDFKKSRLHHLSYNCIYGTDANPRMARTSKMNMIMHGDGHGGVHHHDGLLNIGGIFENKFDVILTNPPFGSRIGKTQKITEDDKFKDEEAKQEYIAKYGEAYINSLKQIDDNINTRLLDLYDLGSVSTLTEVLFMERCLRLLKKGGRMGMVLPEGVLNTSNLQKVRDYFEGKAKILLICSIPQDVFIAAGATVKPSLIFMKKFTEEEENDYSKAVKKAICEVREKYKDKYFNLNNQLKECNDKKTSEKRKILKLLAELDNIVIDEAKPLIKKYFDYEIPIAKINDAGITSTGMKTENLELLTLEKEFKDYVSENKLWNPKKNVIEYDILENDFIQRTINGEKEIMIW
ncbi:MAG: N-6 DNA methylase [Clostridia bacterium]|jgi:type I restriction enzyme M protein|nr:N-6 DNA methylase [Clostridia bacterium]